MDSFKENVESYNKKVKLVLVAIFAFIILLISFDIFVGLKLQKNYTELTQRIDASVTLANKNIDLINETRDLANKNRDLVNKTIEKQNFKMKEGKMVKIEQDGFYLGITNNTLGSSPELFNCSGERNQEWDLSNSGELKKHKLCVTHINATVRLEKCNGFTNQKWRYIAGVLYSPEYDMCLETIKTKSNISTATNSKTIEQFQKRIIAAKCDPTINTQRFNTTTIYVIDRICTFKQGSLAFPGDGEWIITDSGYIFNDTHWLTYDRRSLSFSKNLFNNQKTQKWEYTNEGQIKILYKSVCVGTYGNKIEVDKCDLNLESQRWICT